MKLIIAAALGVLLGGCAANTEHEGSLLSDGNVIYTVRCGANLGECHNDARQICGAAGYKEVDRYASGGLGNDGRFDDQLNARSQGTGVYKEDVRTKVHDQGLTIRCNHQPPQ